MHVSWNGSGRIGLVLSVLFFGALAGGMYLWSGGVPVSEGAAESASDDPTLPAEGKAPESGLDPNLVEQGSDGLTGPAEPQRASVEDRFSVLTESGDQVAEASVFLGTGPLAGANWDLRDPGEDIAQRSDGSTQFSAPDGALDGGVVVVLAPGFRGRALRLSSAETEVRLEAAEEIKVRVVGPDEQPASAKLAAMGFAPLDVGRPGQAGALWGLSSGIATTVHRIPYTPGGGRIVVEGSVGKASWEGVWPGPGEVLTLRLGGDHEAFGAIAGFPKGTSGARVSARLTDDPWNSSRWSTDVALDGSWRVTGISAGPGQGLVFRLAHPTAEVFEASVPSTRLEGIQAFGVELGWMESVELTVEVTDRETGAVIPFPTISLLWLEGEHWSRLDGGGDQGGVVRFHSAPSGETWFRLVKPGYALAAHGPWVLPSQKENGIRVLGDRTASISGRVFADGQAVGEFSLLYSESGGEITTTAFAAADDGAFVLKDLPRRVLELYALADSGAPSRGVTIDLRKNDASGINLVLGELLPMSGRIMHALTFKAVSGATVEAHLQGADGTRKSLIDSVKAGADGRYSGLMVGAGRTLIRATADGFTPRSMPIMEARSRAANGGSLLLRPAVDIELRLTGGAATDFKKFEFAPNLGWLNQERQRFSDQGTVQLDGLPMQRLGGLLILPPWDGAYELLVNLPAMTQNFLEVPVDVGRTVRVQVEHGGRLAGEDLYLRTSLKLGEMEIMHTRAVGKDGVVVCRDLPLGRVRMSLVTHAGLKGNHWFDLGEPGDQSVEFELSAASLRLRLASEWKGQSADIYALLVAGSRPSLGLNLGRIIDGELQQESVEVGTQSLVFWGTGEAFLGVRMISLVDGENEIELDPAWISPVVLQTQGPGGPQANAELVLSVDDLESGAMTFITNGAGRTRQAQLSEGQFQVRVISGQHWPDVSEITVDHATSPKVLVRRKGSLVLSIQREGLALPGALVSLTSELDGVQIQAWSSIYPGLGVSQTDAFGVIRLKPLPAGRYHLRVTAGSQEHEEWLDVGPGEPTQKTVAIP